MLQQALVLLSQCSRGKFGGGGDVSHGNWYLGKVELVSDKRYLAFSVYFVINFLIPMIFSRVIKLAVSSDHNTDSKEFIVFCSIKPNSNSMQFIQ